MSNEQAAHGTPRAAAILRAAMDKLYWACVVIAGSALVLICAVIPWAVFTRYVLNDSASWPERAAVLMAIVLTFIGTAACYRVHLHMNVSFFVGLLPTWQKRWTDLLCELLVGAMACFMVVYGFRLVGATWLNSIDEFPWLSVGLTYLPIPLGGVALLLFVLERLLIGPPLEAAEQAAH